jgi:ferredoxin
MATVTADLKTCVGYANCVLSADDYFDENDGAVVVLRADVAPQDRARVEEAVASCPVKALTLED